MSVISLLTHHLTSSPSSPCPPPLPPPSPLHSYSRSGTKCDPTGSYRPRLIVDQCRLKAAEKGLGVTGKTTIVPSMSGARGGSDPTFKQARVARVTFATAANAKKARAELQANFKAGAYTEPKEQTSTYCKGHWKKTKDVFKGVTVSGGSEWQSSTGQLCLRWATCASDGRVTLQGFPYANDKCNSKKPTLPWLLGGAKPAEQAGENINGNDVNVQVHGHCSNGPISSVKLGFTTESQAQQFMAQWNSVATAAGLDPFFSGAVGKKGDSCKSNADCCFGKCGGGFKMFAETVILHVHITSETRTTNFTTYANVSTFNSVRDDGVCDAMDEAFETSQMITTEAAAQKVAEQMTRAEVERVASRNAIVDAPQIASTNDRVRTIEAVVVNPRHTSSILHAILCEPRQFERKLLGMTARNRCFTQRQFAINEAPATEHEFSSSLKPLVVTLKHDQFLDGTANVLVAEDHDAVDRKYADTQTTLEQQHRDHARAMYDLPQEVHTALRTVKSTKYTVGFLNGRAVVQDLTKTIGQHQEAAPAMTTRNASSHSAGDRGGSQLAVIDMTRTNECQRAAGVVYEGKVTKMACTHADDEDMEKAGIANGVLVFVAVSSVVFIVVIALAAAAAAAAAAAEAVDPPSSDSSTGGSVGSSAAPVSTIFRNSLNAVAWCVVTVRALFSWAGSEAFRSDDHRRSVIAGWWLARAVGHHTANSPTCTPTVTTKLEPRRHGRGTAGPRGAPLVLSRPSTRRFRGTETRAAAILVSLVLLLGGGNRPVMVAAQYTGDLSQAQFHEAAWDWIQCSSSLTFRTASPGSCSSPPGKCASGACACTTDPRKVSATKPLCQTATAKWGDIGAWKVSKVANFDHAFSADRDYKHGDCSVEPGKTGCSSSGYNSKVTAFTLAGISKWITTSVVSASSMFQGASAFNADLGGWDTSKLTFIYQMFYKSAKFVGTGLSKWDTSKLGLVPEGTDPYKYGMKSTFREAVVFDQDLSKWNVHKKFLIGSTGTSKGLKNTFTKTKALSDCNKKKIADSWGSGSDAPKYTFSPKGQGAFTGGTYETWNERSCAATCGDADGYHGAGTDAVAWCKDTGKVYDSTKSATECAAASCSASSNDDKTACCKTAPMNDAQFKAAT